MRVSNYHCNECLCTSLGSEPLTHTHTHTHTHGDTSVHTVVRLNIDKLAVLCSSVSKGALEYLTGRDPKSSPLIMSKDLYVNLILKVAVYCIKQRIIPGTLTI